MKPIRFESKIMNIKKLNEDTNHYIISIPKEFTFAPGQYISITMEINGKKIRRPYSIASTPSLKGKAEMVIKLIPHGLLTPSFFKLKENDQINVLGPLGFFKIENMDKNIVFISTGTGIGPFRSMINHLLENNFKNNITLLAGYRKTKLYDEEFINLSKKNPNFTYKSVLSPNRIQNLLENIKTEDTDFYICGLLDMITSVKGILIKKGVEMKNIISEKYD